MFGGEQPLRSWNNGGTGSSHLLGLGRRLRIQPVARHDDHDHRGGSACRSRGLRHAQQSPYWRGSARPGYRGRGGLLRQDDHGDPDPGLDRLQHEVLGQHRHPAGRRAQDSEDPVPGQLWHGCWKLRFLRDRALLPVAHRPAFAMREGSGAFRAKPPTRAREPGWPARASRRVAARPPPGSLAAWRSGSGSNCAPARGKSWSPVPRPRPRP